MNHRLLTAAAAASLAMAALAVPAAAQSRPAEAPRSASPFWQPGADRGSDYRDEKASEADNFPTDLVSEVAPARAQYVGLQERLRSLQNQLRQRASALETEFSESSEYRQVRTELAAAQDQLRRARQEALADLQEDVEYNALASLQNQLSRQITAEHRQPQPDEAMIRAMSEQALQYGQERAAMERAALEDSDSYIEAQERLQELGQRSDELEQAHARTVREDQELTDLRQQVAEVRATVKAAGAYYDSAAYAADVAVDFAYDRIALRYGNPFHNRYGYGHGYGYGGWWGGWGHFPRYGFPVIISGVGPVNTHKPEPIISNVFRQPAGEPVISNVARNPNR